VTAERGPARRHPLVPTVHRKSYTSKRQIQAQLRQKTPQTAEILNVLRLRRRDLAMPVIT